MTPFPISIILQPHHYISFAISLLNILEKLFPAFFLFTDPITKSKYNINSQKCLSHLPTQGELTHTRTIIQKASTHVN